MIDFESYCSKKFHKIINDYCKVACQQVRQQWNAYSVNGNSKIGFDIQNAESVITACIIASGQKAWILEFGKGSLMDSDNPFLNDYISGDIFYRERLNHSMTILGRPKGEYSDLDGNKFFSSGKFEGIPVENIDDRHQPLPAHHIIKNILFGDNDNGLISQMNSELNLVVKSAVHKLFSTLPKKVKIA